MSNSVVLSEGFNYSRARASGLPEVDLMLSPVDDVSLVDEVHFRGGLTVFVGHGLDVSREAVVSRFPKSSRVVVVSDDLFWKPAVRPTRKDDSSVTVRSYRGVLAPWYDGSFDPFGSTLRMRPDLLILDDGDSKTLWFPWACVANGSDVVLLLDADRLAEWFPDGVTVESLWEMVRRNPVAHSGLFHVLEFGRVTFVVEGEDGRWSAFAVSSAVKV